MLIEADGGVGADQNIFNPRPEWETPDCWFSAD